MADAAQPEADTRYWDNLPAHIDYISLPDGAMPTEVIFTDQGGSMLGSLTPRSPHRSKGRAARLAYGRSRIANDIPATPPNSSAQEIAPWLHSRLPFSYPPRSAFRSPRPAAPPPTGMRTTSCNASALGNGAVPANGVLDSQIPGSFTPIPLDQIQILDPDADPAGDGPVGRRRPLGDADAAGSGPPGELHRCDRSRSKPARTSSPRRAPATSRSRRGSASTSRSAASASMRNPRWARRRPTSSWSKSAARSSARPD